MTAEIPDTLHELRDAVLRTPLDDAPRRRLADWLQRRADPRGDFVRTQLDLEQAATSAEPGAASRFQALFRASQHLLGQHLIDWVAPLRPWGKRPRFHRGFVETIEISAEDFLGYPRAPFGVEPIMHVRFTKVWPQQLPQLMNDARLRRLYALSFEAPVDDGALKTIAQSPHLEQLVGLYFGANEVTLVGADALAASDRLPSLEEVGLRNDDLVIGSEVASSDWQGRIDGAAITPVSRMLIERHGDKPWLRGHPETVGRTGHTPGWRALAQQRFASLE